METNNQYYFAIDSDILRSLTLVDILLKKDPNYNLRSDNDVLLAKWGQYLKYFYLKIKSGQIMPVIVETVYLENKHSKSVVAFMKEYCYFPNVNAVNYQTNKEKAKSLAYAYCEPYNHRGEIKPAPMRKKYNAAMGENAPINDCFIMAQATVAGVPLVTANGKDFIFDELDEMETKRRASGITSINHALGYHDMTNNNFATAFPIHIKKFGPMLKNDNFSFDSMTPLTKFVRGIDIIEDSDNTINTI